MSGKETGRPGPGSIDVCSPDVITVGIGILSLHRRPRCRTDVDAVAIERKGGMMTVQTGTRSESQFQDTGFIKFNPAKQLDDIESGLEGLRSKEVGHTNENQQAQLLGKGVHEPARPRKRFAQRTADKYVVDHGTLRSSHASDN